MSVGDDNGEAGVEHCVLSWGRNQVQKLQKKIKRRGEFSKIKMFYFTTRK